MPDFIQGVDHIEMFVSDRAEAARWYEKIFGFGPIQELDEWSKIGPLFVGNREKTAVLAMMDGTKDNDGSINRVAFRTSGVGFVDFVKRLNDMDLFCLKEKVTKASVVDHDLAYSLYFDDPDGNKLELTSYDHDYVKVGLKQYKRIHLF